MDISTRHPQWAQFSSQWARCRDATRGADAIKAAKTRYLPALGSHRTSVSYDGYDPYDNYLARAVFFGATRRTVLGLSGAIMRKPATIQGIPQDRADVLQSLGEASESADRIAANLATELVSVGRSILIVGAPEGQDGYAARPFVSAVPAEAVISWREDLIGDRKRLTRLVVQGEEAAEVDGQTRQVPVWYEYALVDGAFHLRKWIEQTGADGKSRRVMVSDVSPTKAGGRPWAEIPALIVNACSGIATDCEDSPSADLVELNLAHYRSSADLEFGSHLCSIPQPWVKCFDLNQGSQLVIGSGRAWSSENPNAQAQYLEFSGSGLGSIAAGLVEKEKQMATIGARMLEAQPETNETFGAVRLRQSGDRAVLGKISDATSQAMTQVLRWVLQWSTPSFDSPAVAEQVLFRCNSDYDSTPIEPAQLQALVASLQAGTISWQTFHHNLSRGELLPDGVSAEEEARRIAEGMPGRAKKEEIPVMQADVQASRISLTTYLTQMQARGYYAGQTVQEMVAAIEAQQASSEAAAIEAQFARVVAERLPQDKPEPQDPDMS